MELAQITKLPAMRLEGPRVSWGLRWLRVASSRAEELLPEHVSAEGEPYGNSKTDSGTADGVSVWPADVIRSAFGSSLDVWVYSE